MKDKNFFRSDDISKYRGEDTNNPSHNSMHSSLPILMKKDKEIEDLQMELRNKNEKINEFEYLIVKASEEVRKKHNEMNELKNQLTQYRAAYDQLPQLQEQLERTNINNSYQKSSKEIQLRVELQKEKELSSSLQEICNQERARCENLERQLTALINKSAKFETEIGNLHQKIERMENEDKVKNKTIENAEIVIKRLMKEKEGLAKVSEEFQQESLDTLGKMKKYKGKVKTLKSLQTKKNETIKRLEEQLLESENLKRELEQAREDLARMIHTKMEERKEHVLDIQALKAGQDRAREEVEAIIRENRLLVEEKEGLIEEFKKEKSYSAELKELLATKEQEIESLQKKLVEEKERMKIQLETFTKQATRAMNILKTDEVAMSNVALTQTLPPLYSISNQTPTRVAKRNVTFSQSPLNEISNFDHSLNLSKDVTAEIPTAQGKRLKATPLKTTNKGTLNYVLGNSQTLSENCIRISQLTKDPDLNNLRDQEVLREEPKKDISSTYNVEGLKLELSFALEREEFLIRLIEKITKESETQLQELQEKLNNQPALPPIVEAAMMRKEELNQKFEDMVFKYYKASKLVLELESFSKQLLSIIKESGLPKEEHQHIKLDERGEQEEPQRDLQFTTNAIKNLTFDHDYLKNELNVLRDIVDTAYEEIKCSPEYSGLSGDFQKPGQDRSGGFLPKKLRELLCLYENKISSLRVKNSLLQKNNFTARGDYDSEMPENEKGLSYKKSDFTQAEDLKKAYEAEFHRMVEEIQQRIILKDRELSQGNHRIQELEKSLKQYQEKFTESDSQLAYYKQKVKNLEMQGDEVAQLRRLIVMKDQELLQRSRATPQDKNEYSNASSLGISALTRLLEEKEIALSEKIRENEALKRSLYEYQMNSSANMQAPELDRTLASQYKSYQGNEQKSLNASYQDHSPSKMKRNRSNLRSPSSRSGSPMLDERAIDIKKISGGKDLARDTIKQDYRLRIELEELRNTCILLKRDNQELIKKVAILSEAATAKNEYINESHDQSRQRNIRRKSSGFGFGEDLSDTEFLSQDQNFAFENEIMNVGRDTGKFGTTDNSVEAYKLKAKKVFKKRIKELELILRVIDEKVKGYRFESKGYLTHAIKPEIRSAQEIELTGKMYNFVQDLLSKNPNLKTFIDNICLNIDSLYLAYYNSTVIIGNIVKEMFSREREISSKIIADLVKQEIPSLACSISDINVKGASKLKNISKEREATQEIGTLFSQLGMKEYVRLLENALNQTRKTEEISIEVQSTASDLVKRKRLQFREVENSLKKFKDLFYRKQNKTNSVPIDNTYEMIFDIAESMVEEADSLLSFIGKMATEDGNNLKIARRRSSSKSKQKSRSPLREKFKNVNSLNTF